MKIDSLKTCFYAEKGATLFAINQDCDTSKTAKSSTATKMNMTSEDDLGKMCESFNQLIGDINAIMNAHNLAMVALTSRLQHERNYTDEQLERLSGMKRIDIDPTNGQNSMCCVI